MDAYEPDGIKFYSENHDSEVMLCTEDDWDGWLLKKLDDGRWVSMREAQKEDLERLQSFLKRERMYHETEGDPMQAGYIYEKQNKVQERLESM